MNKKTQRSFTKNQKKCDKRTNTINFKDTKCLIISFLGSGIIEL